LAKAASARVRSQYLLINCYSSLATSQKYRGNYEQAIILYQKAIALHGREMGHHATSSAGLALLFVSLASTYCEVGEFRLSEDLLDRAFLILECIDPNLEIMGFANYHYGILCREIQNWDQSLLKLSSAKAIYEGLGNLEMSALCKREIAVALSQRNEQQSIRVDGEASELLLDQSLQALQSIGRPTLHLAATHLARGMYYFDRKKFEKAMLDFEESERILIERAPFSVELARTYIAIAESLVVSGDIIGALGRYQQAMTIFERHHSKTPAMIRTAKKIKQLEVESVAERSD
jgi:tetratricopeptide (TPR) repeat protein